MSISNETLYNLEDNLLLFFTGYTRAASSILKDQDDKSQQQRPRDDRQPAFRQGTRPREQEALEKGDLRQFAELMNEHWEHKKRRSADMSNDRINDCTIWPARTAPWAAN